MPCQGQRAGSVGHGASRGRDGQGSPAHLTGFMAVWLACSVDNEADVVAETEVFGAAAAEDATDTVEVSDDRFLQIIF